MKLISGLLTDYKDITDIVYLKESIDSEIVNFIIDYRTNSDMRVMLAYTNSGIVSKTINEKDKIVSVSSDLKKIEHKN